MIGEYASDDLIVLGCADWLIPFLLGKFAKEDIRLRFFMENVNLWLAVVCQDQICCKKTELEVLVLDN